MSPYRIVGSTGEWEVVIGLETHAQVISATKLFSSASASYGGAPNAQVHPIDAAMPGMLPVLNRECLRQAIITGLALRAEISEITRFDRKNYFYPDLPAGYQISQFTDPVVRGGRLDIVDEGGIARTIRIERLHLEQDAGKSLHDQDPDRSFIDLNRAGVPLMEIVSYPDLTSPTEARAYVRTLRALLRWLGTCDGNMEEGSLRCDANVSVRRPGAELGTRTEIKNLNSMRFLTSAIEFEARRQVDILEQGGVIRQETRLYDSVRSETRAMRSKEDAHDYRYFPDPDLLPVEIASAWVTELRDGLPELPWQMRDRLMQAGLPAYNAEVLTADREVALFFEAGLAALRERVESRTDVGEVAVDFSNLVITDFFGALNKANVGLAEAPIGSDALAELASLRIDGTISGRSAKAVFETMWETGRRAAEIVEQSGLRQVTDTGAIEAAVNRAIAAHPDQLAQYRAGKEKLLGFFVGQVMKETRGVANPAVVNDVLRARLKA